MISLSTRPQFTTLNFSWTIESFSLLAASDWDDKKKLDSTTAELIHECPDRCNLKFWAEIKSIHSAIKHKALFIRLKNMGCNHSLERHLREKHGFSSISCQAHLIGRRGWDLSVNNSIYIDYFVYTISLGEVDALEKLPDLLYNGALEFRMSLTLMKMVQSVKTIPTPSDVLDDLAVSYGHLLDTGAHSDFTIKLKDGSLKVHKAILVARSAVFDKMLSTDLKESKENVLNLETLNPQVVRKFVRYLYVNRLPVNEGKQEIEEHVELLKLADQYLTPLLKAFCECILIQSMSVGNVVELLKLADLYEAERLLEGGLRFFVLNKAKLNSEDALAEFTRHSNKLETRVMETLSQSEVQRIQPLSYM